MWFSDLARTPVRDAEREIGRAEDLVLRLEETGFPSVTGVLVYVDDQPIFVSADKIATITPEVITTTQPIEEFAPFERRPGEILVDRDLLNHHLIWTRPRHRPRLVTARDVGITAGDGWRAAGIDVAGHRRSRLFRSSRADTDRQIVDWRELLPLVGHVPTARRRLELRNIRKLHPAQLADLLEQASDDEGREIFSALQSDPEFEADVVEELEPSRRREALRGKSDTELGELLGTMEPDDAVDLLLALDQRRREDVLALIPLPERSAVKKLLLYHPETAGGLMTTDVVSIAATDTIGEACTFLRTLTDPPTNLWSIFVVDSYHRLVGQLPLINLLTAAPETTAADLVTNTNPPRVSPDAELSDIAVTMADYNLAALAVVDEGDHILGVVTVDDVLPRTLSSGWRRRKEVLDED
ncbi:MAG: magnesium transporter MgtE N-terminal domain-containing protein [Ferrimicrobium sp.]